MTGISACAQLRRISSELSDLTRPDGSVTLNHGDTSVIASVYGPGDVKTNKERLDEATVDVVYKPKSGLPGCKDKSLEELLCSTFKTILLTGAHPRSSIGITIQEVQDSGSFIAACINAACLAMLDASIEMCYTAAAVNCCMDKDGNVILDPTKKQEAESVSRFMYVFECRDKNVVTLSATGTFTAEVLDKCTALCREASDVIFEYYRDCIKKKMSKSVN